MSPYREVAHTADLALQVDAPDLATLLIDAAHGMIDLMVCRQEPGAPAVQHEVDITADDSETLLVDWLGELLYRYEVYGECLDRFEALDVGPRHVRIRAHGTTGALARRAIKAVTYSGLTIAETPDGYRATVTFDV